MATAMHLQSSYWVAIMDMGIAPTPTPIIHMVTTWVTTRATCTIANRTMVMQLELTTVWVTILKRISNV